jgi:hypothetical protein
VALHLQQVLTYKLQSTVSSLCCVCAAVSVSSWLQLYPTVQQAAAMRQLVSSLRLAPAVSAAAGLGPEGEQLVPDDTLNPSIQRFYYFMGQRALDPQHQVGFLAAVHAEHATNMNEGGGGSGDEATDRYKQCAPAAAESQSVPNCESE